MATNERWNSASFPAQFQDQNDTIQCTDVSNKQTKFMDLTIGLDSQSFNMTF